MLGVKNTEVPELLKQVIRLTEEEHGGLDVEHGVQVL